MRKIKHSEQLGFTIVAEPNDYRVDFVIYEIEGWAEGETAKTYDVPLWHRAGSDAYPDSVLTLEEAEPYLHGSVRFDGCSNWYFDEQDRTMLHGCSREDILHFGEVMAMCWDWAEELCPHWIAP